MNKIKCYECNNYYKSLSSEKNRDGYIIQTDICVNCLWSPAAICIYCGFLEYKDSKNTRSRCHECSQEDWHFFHDILYRSLHLKEQDDVMCDSSHDDIIEGDLGKVVGFDKGVGHWRIVIRWDYKGFDHAYSFPACNFPFRRCCLEKAKDELNKVKFLVPECNCGGPLGHVPKGIHCRL